MAKKKHRKKKSADDISSENEFLKMKMMAEFGGDYVSSEKIPPSVENKFLKQIISFQKQFNQNKTISLHEYIGEPEYNHTSDLSDSQIKKQLKKLLAYMKKKRVLLEVLAPTPDREIYRFITEELFKHQVEDIRVKGWISHFVYEDFHPNDEYDIKNSLHHLLLFLYDKATPLFESILSEEMKDHLGLSMDSEDWANAVQDYKAQFYTINLLTYDITEIGINKKEGTAYLQCSAVYKTQPAKGKRSKRRLATVEVWLHREAGEKGWWKIERVNEERED